MRWRTATERMTQRTLHGGATQQRRVIHAGAHDRTSAGSSHSSSPIISCWPWWSVSGRLKLTGCRPMKQRYGIVGVVDYDCLATGSADQQAPISKRAARGTVFQPGRLRLSDTSSAPSPSSSSSQDRERLRIYANVKTSTECTAKAGRG